MKSDVKIRRGRSAGRGGNIRKIMKCLCSGEKAAGDDGIPASESPLPVENSASGRSSRTSEINKKPEIGNIEEAESSLRESGSLNYEEARALLGRYEYQKGNIEAALHVFEGIDIAAITSKIMISIGRRGDCPRRRSQSFTTPPMSMHTVSLLLEGIFFKSKSLQALGKFGEAARTCKVILDILESSFPEGLPENFGADCKLQETVTKSAELLPELWKLADGSQEAILSYRRALLHLWNLDAGTTARIQKEFAIFLLYSGTEACPPNLRSQMDSSFVPKNNIEEAILLFMILLRKVILKRIDWDPSILDHLSFALTISGDTRALAGQIEELPPGILHRQERYHALALCYYGAGEDLAALNLLRKVLGSHEDPKSLPPLLMASKICGENCELAEEGTSFAYRALKSLDNGCDQLEGVANCLLGISLSVYSKFAVADSEKSSRQCEAMEAIEAARKKTRMTNPNVLYHSSLQYADERNLDSAFHYARKCLKLEGGSNIKTWLLLARILSAQQRYTDSESIINAALDQTGKWDQGELLRTKAKLLLAQDEFKGAIETYSRLLAIFQIRSKSFGSGDKKLRSSTRRLQMEVWHDLALVYIRLSQWHDAEACLSKSKAICSHSASRCHITGMLYEAKGLYKEALKAFMAALDIDPIHVPSLVSSAVTIRHLGHRSHPVVRSFLMDALRLDQTNHAAWYNLGLFYKSEGTKSSLVEAVECFEAAAFLEESAPVEPFR
ncbi:protein NPGR2 [Cucurbita maxima]|uniref:Protein NPGR2 n=1 Tax=Cucurbita maxima TaxID=3661 RepID=A0A6J1HQ56_CUCMA|nr:protein NPGR2 [Cucurbita maxima]XP_022967193.1 protein NPGR2 [Cucurbita maxima]XP_022967194.1 protein NPGR2 [Cucurbita maxima]XP_022967195.1 protein NPGR2 [Cucurbita maxima]XP_022967196.1 protein NPGR2 [Cucurbita maxima]XP_022967197.1 protein NPGR2 [Cucurbita maxima]